MPSLKKLVPHSRKGIYVEASAGQYACCLGYDLNARGDRARARHRLTADPEEATLRHIQLTREWSKTVAEWPLLKNTVRAYLPPQLTHADLSKPFWIKPEWRGATQPQHPSPIVDQRRLEPIDPLQEISHLSETHGLGLALNVAPIANEPIRVDVRPIVNEAGDFLNLLPPVIRDRLLLMLRLPPADSPKSNSPPPLTIEQAKDRFLTDFRARVGKGNRFGRTDATYNSISAELERCLIAIDRKMLVRDITISEIRRFCAYWMDLDARDIRPRTAENRVNALRQFFRAMDEEDAYGFTMPKGAVTAFGECKAFQSSNRITKIDPKTLRSMLDVLPDESRLHVLLSLNIGGYPEDISKLKIDALTDEHGSPYKGKGEPYLKWRRSKTLRVNDFDSLHFLWPETYALLVKHRARANNPHKRMLLNQDGNPLTSNQAGKGRTDVISRNIRRRCSATKTTVIPMMQLRKFGATAIARIASLDVQMMYRAERPRGSSKDYVLFDYAGKLTPALKAWREELLTANAFEKLQL
jgi:hypothetical protein